MTPRAESTAPDHRAAAAWIAANATALHVAATDISATDAPYSPVSIYVEAHWLPIIGPSAFVTWRRLTLMVDWTRVIVDLSELGSELGLTSGCGPNSVIVRTLARLVRFGFAHIEHDTFYVRRAVGPLPPRLVRRLPATLRSAHETGTT